MAELLITGNPWEGFEFYGPFETSEDAIAYAERKRLDGGDWWVCEINPPEGV
jgi:hypothetical protein